MRGVRGEAGVVVYGFRLDGLGDWGYMMEAGGWREEEGGIGMVSKSTRRTRHGLAHLVGSGVMERSSGAWRGGVVASFLVFWSFWTFLGFLLEGRCLLGTQDRQRTNYGTLTA